MTFRPCAVVPSHNHHTALPSIVASLRTAGLEIIVIDDASEEPARSAIAALDEPAGGVEVIRLAANRGKGGAVSTGLRRAAERGFTHAVQIDADGQHDLASLPRLLELARANPGALISGRPIYDASVPMGRKIGRWITHVWVWVETLSTRIADSMCGFRVYPLKPALAVLDSEAVGQRMDFDPEIMVRMFWRGVPVVQIPVRVVYPAGNTSNFELLGDNCRISWMHTRLVLTMIARLPSILWHRPARIAVDEQQTQHWAALGERGTGWGIRLLAAAYRVLGRTGCLAVMWPVVAYFCLTGGDARRASHAFLARAHARLGRPPPSSWTVLRHQLCFAGKALDAFIAWIDPGRVGPVRLGGAAEDVIALADKGVGVMLIVSHLGNAELCRASLAERFGRRINVLLHTRHAALYNGLLKSVRPDEETHAIQVTEVGPDTAIALKERIERGEWIAIAGDRTPVTGQTRQCTVPFLGAPAPFSHGPYVLAALMGCPVYLLFCLREGDGHTAYFEPFAEAVSLPRKDKEAALTALAARYAERLEHYCLEDPMQWYNFYDFWAGGDHPPERERESGGKQRDGKQAAPRSG